MSLRGRLLSSAIIGGLALMALVLVTLRTPGDGQQAVYADHDSVTQLFVGDDVLVDMVPDGSNTANTLGAIDFCRAITAGDAFTFDVVLDRIPAAQNLSGFNYIVVPAPSSSLPAELVVTARDNFAAGVNILTNEGSGTNLDLGTAPPAALDNFSIAASDLGGTAEAQAGGGRP